MDLKVLPGREARHARNAARERLVKAGYKKWRVEKVKDMVDAIEKQMNEKMEGSVDDLVRKFLTYTNKPLISGRTVFNKRQYKPSPQWEINVARAKACQPRLWTPKGNGNGAEYVHGYGRGK